MRDSLRSLVIPDAFPARLKLVQEAENLHASAHVCAGESEGIIEAVVFDPPHKLDENFWKNREQLEEILFLLDEKNWPEAVSP